MSANSRRELSITFSEDDLRGPVLASENQRRDRARERYRAGEEQRQSAADAFADRMTLKSRNTATAGSGRRSRSVSIQQLTPPKPLSPIRIPDPTRRKRHSDREYFQWDSDGDGYRTRPDGDVHGHPASRPGSCLLCKWAREYEEKERRRQAVQASREPDESCVQVDRILYSRNGWENSFLKTNIADLPTPISRSYYRDFESR
ncbi:unnamed protein product, partial [Mesorhabditis spiculigera]